MFFVPAVCPSRPPAVVAVEKFRVKKNIELKERTWQTQTERSSRWKA
jgi:hypothetical protein